jgi:serine/threonine protein phosphatase PrpC
MAHIVRTCGDLDVAVDTLVRGANEEGGIDNISVVLARIEPQ